MLTIFTFFALLKFIKQGFHLNSFKKELNNIRILNNFHKKSMSSRSYVSLGKEKR
jgi:hypothetical protein